MAETGGVDEAALLAAMEEVDSYRPVRVLAEGPTGRTELVRRDGGPLCVRKSMPLSLASEGAWRAAATCHEPHLPRVEGVWRMPDELVVAYRYVEGPTLERLVGQEGPLGEGRALSLLLDLCGAAAALHEADVVHRDITPKNVVVASDGAHLIDLGIARLHEGGRSSDTTTLGTVGYAAPEQFGFAQTDARSDVYSLGRVLAFMLSGRRPQAADATAGLAEAGVGEATVGLVARACAFEPSARFQGARELAAAARDAGGREGAPPRSPSSELEAHALSTDGGGASPPARPAADAGRAAHPGAWHWLASVALIPQVVRALVGRGPASGWRRLAAGCLIALAALMTWVLVGAGVRDLMASPGLDAAFEAAAFASGSLWWLVLPATEVGARTLGCDGYEPGLRGRGVRLALSLAQDALAGLAAVFVLAAVLAAIHVTTGG